MAYVHGKGTTLLLGGYNLSSWFKEASVSNSFETAETTTFGNSAKTYITGLADGTMSLSGMFDGAAGAVDEYLSTVVGATASATATVCPEGLTYGKAAFSCAARHTSYEISAPVGDVVSAKTEIKADGGINRGVLLAAAAAVTTTGTGTGVDQTASSTLGAIGYLHVTANTRTATSTFKVQHSTDNTTFADLITFTGVATNVVSGERVAVATGTTVNRYVRASHTPGGSTGSITYSINFARR